jgi:uncharacterized membrane protein
MAFCKSCGADIGGAAFCPKCGAGQSAAPAAPAASADGLAENVAGLLCYAVGWITGIIFLLIDKRPFVKFHAAQSIVVYGAITLFHFIGRILFIGGGFLSLGFLWIAVDLLVGLLGFILWILLMVKAFQHEQFRLPVAAEIAEGIARS